MSITTSAKWSGCAVLISGKWTATRNTELEINGTLKGNPNSPLGKLRYGDRNFVKGPSSSSLFFLHTRTHGSALIDYITRVGVEMKAAVGVTERFSSLRARSICSGRRKGQGEAREMRAVTISRKKKQKRWRRRRTERSHGRLSEIPNLQSLVMRQMLKAYLWNKHVHSDNDSSTSANCPRE